MTANSLNALIAPTRTKASGVRNETGADLLAEAASVRERLEARKRELLTELSAVESALMWRRPSRLRTRRHRGTGAAADLLAWIVMQEGEFTAGDARCCVPHIARRQVAAMLSNAARSGHVIKVRRGVWERAEDCATARAHDPPVLDRAKANPERIDRAEADALAGGSDG